MWSSVESGGSNGRAVPCARGKHSATLLGGHVYVLGGRGAGGAVPLRDFWRYSLATGKWEKLECRGEPPPSLQEHSATAHEAKLYVFGGEAGALSNETPLWIYDTEVSWIRKRDLHILTVGVHTYSSDARFAALHADGSDEWTLRVAPAQPRDSGAYECQVSTEPKISLSFRLTVVVSKAEILSGPELFVRAGSDINLTCVAKYAPDPPSFIYWYRGEQVVNYAQRGGISVETEQRTRTSRLLIARAAPHDSGNYTCAPSSSESASVIVHVLSGERPAAMQSSGSTPPCLNRAILVTLTALSTLRQPRPALLVALPVAAHYVTIPTLLITFVFANALLKLLAKSTRPHIEPTPSR